MRVLIPYQAWAQDKEALKKNLQHLVRAANQRGIGVMPTLMYAPGQAADKSRWPETRAFAADLVASRRQGAWPGVLGRFERARLLRAAPSPANRQRMEHALYMVEGCSRNWTRSRPSPSAPPSPTTCPSTATREDVLSFHNYLPTRGAIAPTSPRPRRTRPR